MKSSLPEAQEVNRLALTPLCRSVRKGLNYGTMLTASSVFVSVPAMAQDNDSSELMLEEVTVTAQKRAQSMQDVPIAITAFSSEQIEKLAISNFDDYALLMPNVAFKSGGGSGTATIYMRGLSDGGDANPSGSTPSVGLYLDEQPVTTIGSNLDIHIYDIERIEALAGPQGTLYGASSQAGTIRIITNKPNPEAFEAGYDLGLAGTTGGDPSYRGEGFVNIPLGERAALRMVAWYVNEGGWIDNVPGSRTYNLEWGLYNYDPNAPYGRFDTIDNKHLVANDINEMTKTGARAALKVDLNDNWSGTLSLITQDTESDGVWEYDPNLNGKTQIQRFYPDYNDDKFTQLGLTIEGNFENHQLIYAGTMLDRDVDSYSDYTAYGEYASFVPYYACDYSATGPDLETQSNTDCTSLKEYYTEDNTYDRQSHEVRFQSMHDGRWQYIFGFFYEKQEHDYFLGWWQPEMSPTLSVPPFDDLYFRTDQVRTDKQQALFGEVTFMFTENFSGTLGARYFDEDHSVRGVVGWGPGVFCPNTPDCRDTNADSDFSNDDTVFKGNLTWHLSDNAMIYATYSEGYRPGGINRDPNLPSQIWVPDFVTNYEFGWKTTLADGRVRFNGAAYLMDWDDVQYTVYNFSLSACCGNVYNLSTAEVKGVEADITWLASENLTISAAGNYNNGKTTGDFELPNGLLSVPEGTRLPNVPKFKGNIFARYDFAIGEMPSFVQLTWSYTGSSNSEIVPASSFSQSSYNIANLRGGITRGNWGIDLFVNNLTNERAEIYVQPRNYEPTVVTNRPRNYGLRFWQRF